MSDTFDLARYAATFAADAGTDALYYERDTYDVQDLCVTIAQEAIDRKKQAEEDGRDFWPLAFVEAAALFLASYPAASLEQLYEAGNLVCDNI